ncbi:Mucin-associated surface protein (MASP) subgroup S034 [Trypanosoma cruzi]|uniref:Mucin-associated surface protein (MASP) subgroup S034 n=1 Tax=Trypanosoma cruzi TaxID=5693 RepID=A0A7J6XJT1_TRYCR|nr:Mucin-associated surface protein (MASP) subgroup S034 [Trypanosoma cruzi]
MMMTGRVLLVCAFCVLWCTIGVVADGDTEEVLEDFVPPSRADETQELQEELRGKGHSANDEQVDETQLQKPQKEGGGHQAEDPLQPVERSVRAKLQSEGPRVEETGNQIEQEQLLRGTQRNPNVENKTPTMPVDKPQGSNGEGDVSNEKEKQKVKETISQIKEEVVAPGAGTPEAISIEGHQEASRNPAEKTLVENKDIAKENNVKKEEKEKKSEQQELQLKQKNGKQVTLHGSPTGPAATQGSLAPVPPEGLQQKQISDGSTKQPEGEAPLIGTESTSDGTTDPPLPSVSTGAAVAATSESDKREVKVSAIAESNETTVNETDDQQERIGEKDEESAKGKTAFETNQTENIDDSDGSTAVSHTTSPLLLLLLLVCCGCGGGRVRVREREPCTARTHTRLSPTLCVCPLA